MYSHDKSIKKLNEKNTHVKQNSETFGAFNNLGAVFSGT